jgi:uncharacterized membrane protein
VEAEMIVNLLFALTFLAILGCGLIAGVFFAFSAFVMGALARLPAAHGIAAMQSINIVVINRLFLGAFFGTAALCVVLALASLFRWSAPGVIWALVGSVLYLVGTILITIRFNVPLNDELAAVPADGADAARVWERYLTAWTMWNSVRTAAALAAAAFLLVAVMRQAREAGL